MEDTLKKVLISLAVILVGLLSFLFIGDKAASVETHEKTIEAIDEKVDTVMKLTAASTVASVGVSAIPGDTATPIAEKLADFTQYFLLVLCVLYAEKYLLTIVGAAAFKILIPIACVMIIAGIFWNPRTMRRLAGKTALLAVVLYLAIPMSVKVSDTIYDTYEASIKTTISSAEELSDETSVFTESEQDEGKLAAIWEGLTDTASTLVDKASTILNRFVEVLAVLIVTSAVIPILVLLFFLWLVKLVTGIDLPEELKRKAEARYLRKKTLE